MFYAVNTDILPFPVRFRSDGANLTELELGRPGADFPELPHAENRPGLELFDAVRRWLGDYAAGKKPDPRRLPLAPAGSDFARAVWEILLEIPYGKTMTYGEVAQRTAVRRGRERMAAQAVGHAVGANPIAIVIPCHRVMGAGGNLTGYGGGLAMKVRLLAHEGVATRDFFRPRESSSPRTQWE